MKLEIKRKNSYNGNNPPEYWVQDEYGETYVVITWDHSRLQFGMSGGSTYPRGVPESVIPWVCRFVDYLNSRL